MTPLDAERPDGSPSRPALGPAVDRPSLATLLEERSLSVQEFAERLGRTKAAVYSWISRSYRPRPPMVRAIAEALGMSVADLMPYLADPVPIGRPRSKPSGR